MKNWYRMQIQDDVADLYIFNLIGDWFDEMINEMFAEHVIITAKEFIDELAKLPDSVKGVKVHINSPGGDVFAAVAIANALRDQRTSKGRTVETSIEGLAASAASIVAQAGDPVRIGDNALVMIHNPWTVGIGEARELRKFADDLDIVRNTIITTYQWHSELPGDEIGRLMDATTWMEADEAIEKGFATEKVDGLKAAAAIDPRSIAKLKIPDRYEERVKALLKAEPAKILQEEPADAKDVLRLCREAQCLDIAESLIGDGLCIEEVQARVSAEQEKRSEAATRALEIRGLCEKARLPELADGYINGQMPIKDIRRHLMSISARLDAVEIDGSLDPDQGLRPKTRINVSEVYATRNRLQLTAKKE